MTTRSDADGPQPSPTKLQSATRWESWYTRKYCYYVVKRSIIIMGQLLIHGGCTVTVGAFKLVKLNHHPKKLVSILDCTRNVRPNRRTGGGGRVRGSVAGSRGGRAGVSVFPDFTAAWRPARAGPPRCTRAAPSARSARPSHPRPGPYVRPTSRIHSQFTRAHVACACARRARTRLTTAFTRHTTRGRRVPPTPDHRPSRPRPDASITVGSEGVGLMARARPL